MTEFPFPSGTPTSYWHATSEPLIPDDPLPSGAEVVVIGGGLLGCWTAYWLARSGVPVVLLEKQMIGWGATGRNAGVLVGGSASGFSRSVERIGFESARDLVALTDDGRSLAIGIVEEEGIDCDFRTPGTLSLVLDDTSLASMRRNMPMLIEAGFPVELLDREGLSEVIHTPLGAEIRGGLYNEAGSLLHPGRYLSGLARAAQRHGARLVQAEVIGLSHDGDCSRISTTAGEIEAKQVVIALNAWTDTLVPSLARLVVPARGQMVVYEPGPHVFDTRVGSDVTPTGEYWQQVPDGSIVVGGCRAEDQNGGLGMREMVPTPEVTGAIERVLPRLFPDLANLRVARRWAGLMAFTSDNMPVADAAPDMPGVWVTGGYGGRGMPFGPRVGQLLAEAVTSGEKPDALNLLRIDRPSLTPLTVPA